MTSAEALSDRLCRTAPAEAVWADETASFDREALRREVDVREATFRANGVNPGDCVAIHMVPCAGLFASMLAIWRLRGRVMLLDHRLTPAEMDRFSRLSPPAFLVRAATAVSGVADPAAVVVQRLAEPAPLSGTACLMQFTSGSTGQAKVVGRSAASLDEEIDRYLAVPDMPGPGDRLLLLSSPVHTWGLIGGVLYGLAAGLPVLFPSAQHGAALGRAAVSLDPTAIFGVPTHFELIGRTASLPQLPRLRIATSAGMVAAPATAERFRAVTGCRLGQVYGMTEVGVITADMAGRFASTAGPPAPGITVRVDDGELYVRLPESPYLVDDGVARYADGWLRTFDRAALNDATGAVTIYGRADSVITIGGLKIDLMEVEQVLEEHPGVSHAVVTFGDVIEAHVAARDGVSDRDLSVWARSRLSPSKLPKRYHVRDHLPATSTGKIIRDRDRLLGGARQQDGADRE